MSRHEPIAESLPDAIPSIDDRWASASWLAGRSPRLTGICRRLDALSYDDHGVPDGVNPDKVAQAVYDSHRHAAEWADYQAHHPAPSPVETAAQERAHDAWEAAGPEPTAAAAAFGVMSGGEKRLVRLLATLGIPSNADDRWDAPVRRAGWAIGDLSGLDNDGWAVVSDWLRLIARAAPNRREGLR